MIDTYYKQMGVSELVVGWLYLEFVFDSFFYIYIYRYIYINPSG